MFIINRAEKGGRKNLLLVILNTESGEQIQSLQRLLVFGASLAIVCGL